MYDVRKDNVKKWAVTDSWAISHFLVVDATMCKVTPTDNPIAITIPDGTTFKSPHVHKLDLP